MKTTKFIYGENGSFGSIKKYVLDCIEEKFNKGQEKFSYTEVHDHILDAVEPNWKNRYSSIIEARKEYRGVHTGMFSDQKSTGRNVLCSPNRWDNRHLVKVSRGVYSFSK
jgi:hypothetical protein